MPTPEGAGGRVALESEGGSGGCRARCHPGSSQEGTPERNLWNPLSGFGRRATWAEGKLSRLRLFLLHLRCPSLLGQRTGAQ